MSKVKEYIYFLREANRPLYNYEKEDIRCKLEELENDLLKIDVQLIQTLSDIDLCRRYHLELRDIHPKYANVDVEKHYARLIMEKTDFRKMRNNILKQVGKEWGDE